MGEAAVREIFLEYAKSGAMTKEQLASALKVTPRWVADRARSGEIPTIPGIKQHRFDPIEMIGIFCDSKKPLAKARSLTTERRVSRGNQNGGFRKCL